MNMKASLTVTSKNKLISFVSSANKDNPKLQIKNNIEEADNQIKNNIEELCESMKNCSRVPFHLNPPISSHNEISNGIEFTTRNAKKHSFLTSIFRALESLPDKLNLDNIPFKKNKLSDLIHACNYLERDCAYSQGGRYFNEFIHIIRYVFTALEKCIDIKSSSNETEKLKEISQELENNIQKNNGSKFSKTAHMSGRAFFGSAAAAVIPAGLFTAASLTTSSIPFISGVCAFCKAVVIGLGVGLSLGTFGIGAAVVVGCGLLGLSVYHGYKYKQERDSLKSLNNTLENKVEFILNNQDIRKQYKEYFGVDADLFFLNSPSNQGDMDEKNDESSLRYAGQSLTKDGIFEDRNKNLEAPFKNLNDVEKHQFYQLYGIMTGAKSLLMSERNEIYNFSYTEYYEFAIKFHQNNIEKFNSFIRQDLNINYEISPISLKVINLIQTIARTFFSFEGDNSFLGGQNYEDKLVSDAHKHHVAFEKFCIKHQELNTYGRGDPSRILNFHTAVRANSKNWELDTEKTIQKRPQNAELLREVSNHSLIKFQQPYSTDFTETREEHYKRMCNNFFELLGINEIQPILIDNKLNPTIGDKLMEMESSATNI